MREYGLDRHSRGMAAVGPEPTEREIAEAVANLLQAVIAATSGAAGISVPVPAVADGSGPAAPAEGPADGSGAAAPAAGPAAAGSSWFGRAVAAIASGAAAGAAGAAGRGLMSLKRPIADLPPPTYAPPQAWDPSANRLADLDMGFAASFYQPVNPACAGRWIPTSKCTKHQIAQDVSSMTLHVAEMNAESGFDRYAANIVDASGNPDKLAALHKKYPEHRILIDGTAYPIANPFLARGARFHADPSNNIVLQNAAILEKLARPQTTRTLDRFNLALLESLWFCSSQESLSNDRRCLPLRLLGELHEQKNVTDLEEQREKRVAVAAAARVAAEVAGVAAGAAVAEAEKAARDLAYLEAPRRYGTIGAYPFAAPTTYGSLARWNRYRY